VPSPEAGIPVASSADWTVRAAPEGEEAVVAVAELAASVSASASAVDGNVTAGDSAALGDVVTEAVSSVSAAVSNCEAVGEAVSLVATVPCPEARAPTGNSMSNAKASEVNEATTRLKRTSMHLE
jgi:hypothetical protein